MIALPFVHFALALLPGTTADPEHFRAGIWEGWCYEGNAGVCSTYIAYVDAPVAVQLLRDDQTISILSTPDDCTHFRHVYSLAWGPRYDANELAELIRADIQDALRSCESKLTAPEIPVADVAALLLKTDDVKKK